MMRRCIILIVTVASSFGIPKGSTKRELQKLVRLPRLEFPIPLQFDRRFGFVAFPDEMTATIEVARGLKNAKGHPDDASLYLEAAEIFDREDNSNAALRHYSRATDLFRRKLDVEPDDFQSLVGLGSALTALGRFAEAESTLERANKGEGKADLELAWLRFYRERAWFAAAGESQRYNSSSFLEQLVAFVAHASEPKRLEEARRYLRLADGSLSRARDGSKGEKKFLLESAAYRSFRNAMEIALTQVQSEELRSRALQGSIYNAEALNDLLAGADLGDDPAVLAAAALAAMGATEMLPNWVPEMKGNTPAKTRGGEGVQDYVRHVASRLQGIMASGGENAAAAAEYLGCVQLHLFKDAVGARRSLQQAVAFEPGRYRSWELLTLASAYEGPDEFVEMAEARVAALPQARSSILLIKSYDRQGDILRAGYTALNAATTYPNDFLVNLSLAAVLLKDDGVEDLLWRVGDAVSKAEKQMGRNPSRQQQVDFVLVKSIYLGLTDRAEEAKSLLQGVRPAVPELQEILKALEN